MPNLKFSKKNNLNFKNKSNKIKTCDFWGYFPKKHVGDVMKRNVYATFKNIGHQM